MKALAMFLMMAVFIGQAASAAEINCKITREGMDRNGYLDSVSQEVSVPVYMDTALYNPATGARFVAQVVGSVLIPRHVQLVVSYERFDHGLKRLAVGFQSAPNQWITFSDSQGPRGSYLAPVLVELDLRSLRITADCAYERNDIPNFRRH